MANTRLDDYVCKRVNVTFDSGTLKLVDHCAAAMGVTRSRFLRIVFRHWLKTFLAEHGCYPWEGDE